MSSQKTIQNITVLGGGAFGTALAATARRAGRDVHLWGRDPEMMAEVARKRRNTRYLPGIELTEGITASADWDKLSTAPDALLLVTPAQTTMEMVRRVAATATLTNTLLVLCAKGIDQSEGRLLSDIARAALPKREVAVLSGPSFATDLARGLPTAVSVACTDLDSADALAKAFSGSGLRCYTTDDVTGVELGGALKNVLAIAAGIVMGRELGASAHAALVTRGLAEMRRLAVALGARAETLSGLSGLGDLMLSCATEQSRNFSFGRAIGLGEELSGRPLAEGVATAGIAAKLADEHAVDAPIISTVSAVLDKRLSVDDAIAALLARPLRVEG